MHKITTSDKAVPAFEFSPLMLDEFIPVIKFDRASFTRPEYMRLVKSSQKVTLSDKIDANKQQINLYTMRTGPGEYTLPFKVEKGYGTWDDDGVIGVKISPENADVSIVKNETVTTKYGDVVKVTIKLSGNEEKQFNVDFYTNDDEDDYNKGELTNLHCGRISVTMAGSSKVGFRLISNIDALPKAPPGYNPPQWNTTNVQEITLNHQQANQYNDCEGVCYATTESRAQQAYIDERGSGVVDLTVSKNNVDHRIAATYGTNDPYMGYGAGGPFARHGFGQTVDDTGVWAGELKAGALLQLWHSTNQNNLYENGGHSVIFRNYVYNDNGDITAICYTDYHGDFSYWQRSDYFGTETIVGVNLTDD